MIFLSRFDPLGWCIGRLVDLEQGSEFLLNASPPPPLEAGGCRPPNGGPLLRSRSPTFQLFLSLSSLLLFFSFDVGGGDFWSRRHSSVAVMRTEPSLHGVQGKRTCFTWTGGLSPQGEGSGDEHKPIDRVLRTHFPQRNLAIGTRARQYVFVLLGDLYCRRPLVHGVPNVFFSVVFSSKCFGRP